LHIEQTPTFRRAYKKLHTNQRQAVNEAIQAIVDDPLQGEEKRGDLSKLFVYKFECVDQQYLLACRWNEDWRFLLAPGPHENVYRDMKR